MFCFIQVATEALKHLGNIDFRKAYMLYTLLTCTVCRMVRYTNFLRFLLQCLHWVSPSRPNSILLRLLKGFKCLLQRSSGHPKVTNH